MKLQSVFTRYKGVTPTGKITLGADGASDSIPATGFLQSSDNAFTGKYFSNQGWPCHRFVVGYAVKDVSGVQVASGDVQGQLWLWDQLSQVWLRAGAAMALKANQVNFFDVAALLDSPFKAADGFGQASSQGGIEALLVVDTAAGATAGSHIFGMGLDLSCLAT